MSSNLQTSNPIYDYIPGDGSPNFLTRSESQDANNVRYKIGDLLSSSMDIELTDFSRNEPTRSNINSNTNNNNGTHQNNQETHGKVNIWKRILLIHGYVGIFIYYGLHCALFGLVILNIVIVIGELKQNLLDFENAHGSGNNWDTKFFGVVALTYLTYYLKTAAAYYRGIYYREEPEGSYLNHWLKAAYIKLLCTIMGVCTAFLILFGFAPWQILY